jgi:hypothetical protein
MNIYGWIVVILLIAAVGLLTTTYFTAKSTIPTLSSTASGPFDLSKETQIIKRSDATPFYENSESTFQAFIYLNPMLRTGTHVPCTKTGQMNLPSCEDGTYALCDCGTNNDCATVCRHDGYEPVFSLGGVVMLEVITVPDSGRQAEAAVQLVIKTERIPRGSAAKNFMETFALPPIPFQKWIMITVARDGRRYDIYYNDSLVLSKKTTYMPISMAVFTDMRGVTSGSTKLTGQLALATIANYRYTSQKTNATYRASVDTRGHPYINSMINPVSGMVSEGASQPAAEAGNIFTSIANALRICPPEGCLNVPTVRPATPLYDWSSNYA